MTPKKAIVILLILSLVIAAVFTFLYISKSANRLNKQAGVGGGADNNASADRANKNEPPKPAEVVQQKIDKIIEEAKKDPVENPPDEVRQEIISTINAEIIKQEQNKTPEQEAADLKAQEERQKIIDRINNQIKQETKTVK